MPRLLFYCLVLAGLLTGYMGYGQCSCTGNVYFVDNDEDGFTAHWYTQDITAAQDEYKRTCSRAQSAGVIVACTQPPKTVSTFSQIDCDDNDVNAQTKTTWYYDGDNNGVGDDNNTQYRCGSPGQGWYSSGGDRCPNDPNTTTGLNVLFKLTSKVL
jgi:hypothetical protein